MPKIKESVNYLVYRCNNENDNADVQWRLVILKLSPQTLAPLMQLRTLLNQSQLLVGTISWHVELALAMGLYSDAKWYDDHGVNAHYPDDYNWRTCTREDIEGDTNLTPCTRGMGTMSIIVDAIGLVWKCDGNGTFESHRITWDDLEKMRQVRFAYEDMSSWPKPPVAEEAPEAAYVPGQHEDDLDQLVDFASLPVPSDRYSGTPENLSSDQQISTPAPVDPRMLYGMTETGRVSATNPPMSNTTSTSSSGAGRFLTTDGSGDVVSWSNPTLANTAYVSAVRQQHAVLRQMQTEEDVRLLSILRLGFVPNIYTHVSDVAPGTITRVLMADATVVMGQSDSTPPLRGAGSYRWPHPLYTPSPDDIQVSQAITDTRVSTVGNVSPANYDITQADLNAVDEIHEELPITSPPPEPATRR